MAGMLGGHLRAALMHRWAGYAVVAGPLIAMVFKPKAVAAFFREASRLDAGDGAWWARFPGFLLRPSSRPPARHRGHFDPGQRLMGWALVVVIAVIVATGILMVAAVDLLGGAFGVISWIHAAASVVLALLLVGHVGISAGVLKGYRGVWRAMHFPGGGMVSEDLAHTLWPEWAESQINGDGAGRVM